ncbi:MAG: N-acetylmuramic acid 6-phosphate etherase [Planctomycetota bacterium]|nr:N-acetylmuramic acid 6-phosphate etherase [Planctomycetota bacterium]
MIDLPPSESLDPRAAQVSEPEQLWDLFEEEEQAVLTALQRCRDEILELSSRMATTLVSANGRVIGLGAGTSGRILALDMAEWGPTYSVPEHRRVALIAGGEVALRRSVEGAEDDGDAARHAIDFQRVCGDDLVIGVSASGSAAWVREGLSAACHKGASPVLITCNSLPIEIQGADENLLRIALETGAEPVAGSTRLKAATATHRLLQRASTICALRNGWIHRGRMVAMQATNAKLRTRAVNIVSQLTGRSKPEAEEVISNCQGDLRLAIATCWWSGNQKKAEQSLEQESGHLGRVEARIRAFGTSDSG